MLLLLTGTAHAGSVASPPPGKRVEPSRATRARAAAPIPVWLLTEDPAWVARAQGQLSDLDVELRVLLEPAASPFQAQLARCNQLRPPALLAWLTPAATEHPTAAPEGPGAYLYVWTAQSHRLYVRRVGPARNASPPAEWSATLEIAALALRTAVRAATAGRALGVEPLSFKPAADASASPDSPPGAAAERRSWRVAPSNRANDKTQKAAWRAGVYFDWQLGAIPSSGLSAVGASIDHAHGPWYLGLALQAGLPTSLGSAGATLKLGRHLGWLSLAYSYHPSTGVALEPKLAAGLAWYSRSTSANSAQIEAADAGAIATYAMAAGMRFTWEFAPPLWIGFELAAVWTPGAPAYQVVHEDGSVAASHQLDIVAPDGRIGLGVRW